MVCLLAAAVSAGWESLGFEAGATVPMADRPGSADTTPASPPVPDQELAAIILRAAAIGVPAWRVATALGVPSAVWTSADERPPAR